MIKQITAAVLLAVTSFAASAAEPTGFYAGGDVGTSKSDDLSSKTSYGVFGGYTFNENVAVEAGYRRLGKWNIEGFDDKVNQLSLSVLGSVPVANQVAVYGRLGYNRIEEKYTGDNSKTHENKALYGVGVSYAITKEISARVEWQRPVSHSHNISVGVAYHF